MNDDHDWVARLLADSGPVAMPDDVADRLDRALRDAAGPARTSSSAASTAPAGAATPAPADPVDPVDPVAPSRPAVPPTAPVAAGAVPPAADATGSLPRLRSVPLAGEGAGSGTDRSTGTGSAPRTSRRELHDDDVGERRRRLLTRWAPVAAGVLLLGGAGAAALGQLQGGDQATSAAESASDSAAGSAVAAPSRSLVASGTDYRTADQEAFAEQVRALVALTTDPLAEGGVDAQAPASDEAVGGQASADAPASTAVEESLPSVEESDEALARPRSAEDSPLSDPAVLSECVSTVTEGTSTTAAAVDLALVDGVESTVVVVPDAAGLTFQVYVVGPDCSNTDTVFDFFTVAP